ncbi:ABC transporter permease [Helicobacter bizzozeronii]|uniref:Dipeptide transport system permease protein DppC (TC 3.A.1.5.2) n=1 Tax=Helicobacter bizzozeronii (strain CIII-1) TaxID=1002804 RepID=F8KSD4_HELBC|nr:ABC transporter permease [Helicobacter bizzozeronii]CCB79703.1 dipeptide transport system permease protein DppC (TC 3.A.1.5.2) [Helicobacter bizzozeronii CIII-1]
MERFNDFWAQFRKNKAALVGLWIVFFLILCALLAPLISHHDPYAQNTQEVRVLPIWAQGGSIKHVLGTDDLGRDVLTRLLYGARISLTIGIVSVGIAVFFGVLLGLMAGYFGRKTDMVIMRLMDLMLSLPSILLIIIVVAILGPSLLNAMLAIGIVGIPGFARIVRASVLAEKEKEYVIASKVNGSGHLRLMFRVIFPNCAVPIIVQATMGFASAVLEAAGLSFLGLGAQPPTPEWGAMLMDAMQYLRSDPWMIVPPGSMIFLTVMGFNLLGDGIMDALDPKRSA